MDRLFLKFNFKLCVALLIAGVVVRTGILPFVNKRVNNNFEDFLAGPMTVMAEALRDERKRGQGPSELLERTAARFRTPVAVLPREASNVLSAPLRQRLERGEVVCERSDGPRTRLYIAIPDSDLVLRVGPLRPENPLGEGRGAAIFLLFFIALSIGIHLLLRPIRKSLAALAQAAESFRRGELTTRAAVHSRDAIGALAASWNRMAEEIQRLIAAQRQLLQMVSHELRTPLQRIHFTAAILAETTDAAQRDSAILRMERDLHALDELIDELLSYIRLEREVPLQAQAVQLDNLIEDLVDLSPEETNGISLTAADLSKCASVRADPRLLRRALSNLIANALGHAKSRVEVSAQKRDAMVLIDVEDDGPGVPPADRQRIFEPFQRLEHGSAQNRHGYGLGLAIVRRIAERHGGTVEVGGSALGGARFRLSIPQTA